jgi:hypothetical protein
MKGEICPQKQHEQFIYIYIYIAWHEGTNGFATDYFKRKTKNLFS